MTLHITLIPQRRDDGLTLIAAGDTLTINGAALDLSAIPEGATLPAEAIDCPWIPGPVIRQDGTLYLTLILRHGPIPHPAPEASHVVTHPEPLIMTTDGPIPLPHWAPPASDPEEASQ